MPHCSCCTRCSNYKEGRQRLQAQALQHHRVADAACAAVSSLIAASADTAMQMAPGLQPVYSSSDAAASCVIADYAGSASTADSVLTADKVGSAARAVVIPSADLAFSAFLTWLWTLVDPFGSMVRFSCIVCAALYWDFYVALGYHYMKETAVVSRSSNWRHTKE